MNIDPVIDSMAFTLFLHGWMRDDETIYDIDIERLREKWTTQWLPSLSEEHCGDCTNQPCSCTRCHTEEYIKDAEYILSQIKRRTN